MVRGPLVPGKVVSLGVIISVVENHVDKPILYAGDLEYRFEGQGLGPEAEALATASAPAPAPPAPATAGAPAPAPPALANCRRTRPGPSSPGNRRRTRRRPERATASRAVKLAPGPIAQGYQRPHERVFHRLSGYAQKRQEALEYWEGNNFDYLAFTVDKVQAIDSDHALAWVTWSQDARNRKTQELSSGTRSLQLQFAKEEGNWRISDLQEAGAEAPAPPAPGASSPGNCRRTRPGPSSPGNRRRTRRRPERATASRAVKLAPGPIAKEYQRPEILEGLRFHQSGVHGG